MEPPILESSIAAREGHTMQSSHRRSTKVCTRCRRRKTKCDFKFPACTSCEKAQTPCLGYDPTTRQAVPRSLVKSLEARVAELETQALDFRAAAPKNMSYIMASRIAQANLSFGHRPASEPPFRSIISSALLLRPSCPPLAITGDQEPGGGGGDIAPELRGYSNNGSTRHTTGPVINPGSVPPQAVQRMMQNYIDIHLPQYPCVQESLLTAVVQRIQDADIDDNYFVSVQGGGVAALGHYEYFIYFITLAISAITLTWRAEHQARASSEAFFNSALKHLQELRCQDEMRWLRVFLLLANYAHMCPHRADNWTCIANAIRIVISLGLHKESPDMLLGATEAQERRQIFWAAYGMERSLCTNLRLPLSFPEESITTPFEFSLSTLVSSPTSSDVPSDVERRSSANHIYLYRALETEVHRVLHLEEDLFLFGCTTIDEWLLDISARLETWYAKAQSFTKYNMLQFKHVQYTHLRIRIHRPTPRLPQRSLQDRQAVLDAAQILIDDYLAQEEQRRLFYPWHGVHILFETAVITLEACWSLRGDYGPSSSTRAQSVRMLQGSLPKCLQVIRHIGAHQWEAAVVCADKLESLVRRASAALQSKGSPGSVLSSNDEDLSISTDIHALVFSDGQLSADPRASALALGHVMQDGMDLESSSNFFVDSFDFGDMQVFSWDPEWDIVPAEPIL